MLVTIVNSQGGTTGDDGVEVQRQVLSDYPKNSVTYGWFEHEVTDIRMISDAGHTFVGDAPNNSFFQHLPKPSAAQPSQGLAVNYRKNAKYVMLSFSQGDALYYLQRNGVEVFEERSLTVPGLAVKDRVPFAVMHSTLEYELQPNVLRFIYQHVQTPNQLIFGKGYGYSHPSVRDETLGAFIAKSQRAMDRAGFQDLFVNDFPVNSSVVPGTIERLASELRPRSMFLRGTRNGAEGNETEPAAFAGNGVPVFGDPVVAVETAPKLPPGQKVDVTATVQAIMKSTRARQFSWVYFNFGHTAQEMERVYDNLIDKDGVVVVSPADFIRLYKANGS